MCDVPVGDFRFSTNEFEEGREVLLVKCPSSICHFYASFDLDGPSLPHVESVLSAIEDHRKEGIW